MTGPVRARAGADAPTLADVRRAARLIAQGVRRTPLEPSEALRERSGTPVYLKLESLQRTGSFKLRGALNGVGSLPDSDRRRGVATASAGNHGLGVALAARLHGMMATVFVPAGAPEGKRSRIARLGASLRLVEGDYDAAHAEAVAWAANSRIPYIHAFSDPAVVAGQGTVGLEILEELPEVRTLVVPVGGGGLIGGVGIVARALHPRVRVVGVQSRETSAMSASLSAGEPICPPSGATLCDGLAGEVDDRSLRLARDVVDEMVLVDEPAVRRAIHRLYVDEGVVAEGSGAVGPAALYEGLIEGLEGPVVVIVSGANIDAPLLGRILLTPPGSSPGTR